MLRLSLVVVCLSGEQEALKKRYNLITTSLKIKVIRLDWYSFLKSVYLITLFNKACDSNNKVGPVAFDLEPYPVNENLSNEVVRTPMWWLNPNKFDEST